MSNQFATFRTIYIFIKKKRRNQIDKNTIIM